MNPSFEAFVDPPDGSTKNPEPVRTAKDNFHRQRLVRVVVEPRMPLLGLCSFDARRESRFLVWAPKNGGFSERLKTKKSRRKIFLGGRKRHLAAEHHNEAAPKKKKSRGFSAWAPKNIAP